MTKKQLERQIARTRRNICDPLKATNGCPGCDVCGIMAEIKTMEKEVQLQEGE